MVRSSAAVWKEGGGYYSETEEQLRRNPLLPNPRQLCHRRVIELFDRYVDWSARPRLLEIGCGRSPWLAYFAQRKNCSVFGIDIEPFAAQLARANLAGAGAKGEVFCGDGFDLAANKSLLQRFDLIYSWGVMEHFDDPARRLSRAAEYLRPGGRIVTLVPNLQGVNSLMQRISDRERYEMHVVYDRKKLAAIHEDAGFETIADGYVGFCDGYLAAVGPDVGRARLFVHEWLCWMLSMSAEAWCRTLGKTFAPEWKWLAPHVFYVGRRR